MKLIIDISEEEYKEVLEDTYSGTPFENKIFTIIANGIPYEEKPQGKWKYHKAEDIFLAYMECDKCGLEELFDNENMTPKRFRDYYKYCPNCGARMM